MKEKIKKILLNIVAGAVIFVIVVGIWKFTAWRYPDNWISDVPKFGLFILGVIYNFFLGIIGAVLNSG